MRLMFALLLFLALPAAAEVLSDPAYGVREITDGDTLILDTDETVRLVGIQAPKLPLGRPGFKAWPLAEQSRTALQALAQNQALRLRFGGAQKDRHGRILAHLYRSTDDLWIQGEMLRLGMARVYSFSDNRSLVAEMLVLERAARQANRGIWAHPYYAVRTPLELNPYLNSFQLVQGKVIKSARLRDYFFLNFGDDYKTDFTVVIDRRDWRRFEAASIDPAGFKDRIVQVRGWLEYWNGPMLRISHPEQIEVIE